VLLATVLALSSAGLHAAWNLLVKTTKVDRDLATWGQFLLGGAIAVPVLFVIGWPPAVAFPYLLASGLVHVAYVTGLVQAYTHGDFSLAYPLARGSGALLAAAGGVLLLGDVIAGAQWLGIALVAVGLVSLVGRGATLASIGWAVFTAATIAVYTLIDSKGARLSDDGLRYGFALMPFAGALISATQLVRGRGAAFREALPTQWWRWLIAGAFVTIAYSMVMIAVRQPGVAVGYVTMLRESSVVMGALAGWLLLDERLGRHRLVSSCVIVAGLVTLIAFAV
jgi:drug/metabolite transporter (DMT)-like permease